MRFLRDFYVDLPPRDRAVVWVTLGLALAIGMSNAALIRRPAPVTGLSPHVTAPPFLMDFAEARP